MTWLLAHPRAIAAAVALSAFGATLAYAGVQRARVAHLVAENGALGAERDRLAADIQALVENEARNVALLEAELTRERAKAPKVQEVIRRVYVPRDPLPSECDPALDPVRDALDGLRGLKNSLHPPSSTPSS